MNKRELAIVAGLTALASGCGRSELEKQRGKEATRYMLGDVSKELQAFRWGEKAAPRGPRELPGTMQKDRGAGR